MRLRKSKVIKLMFIGCGFVAVCVSLWLSPAVPHQSPVFVKSVALFGFLCFGFCLLYTVRKLFDPTPGFIFDERGFVDNTSGVAVGQVLWADVVGFEERKVSGQTFLSVEVRNPAFYVNQIPPTRRWLIALSKRHPIQISTTLLNIDFAAFKQRMIDFHDRYGEINRQPEASADVRRVPLAADRHYTS